jgi:hypothetical protein
MQGGAMQGGAIGPELCLPLEESFEEMEEFLYQYCGLCH